MKNIIKQVIYDQQDSKPVNRIIARGVPEKLLRSKEILVLSGVRRCGKSTLLQQIRASQKERDYYLNFDDERLISFKVSDFQVLYEIFLELFGEQKTFYFDEIQNISGWERFVRRLYDSGNKVFVTGSNASMLSREMGTHLTGRYYRFELYPFSFIESLQFSGIPVSEKNILSGKGKASIKRHFSKYLTTGGFPQYVAEKNDAYLSALYESILYRDVMVRNNITSEKELKELTYFLASNAAKLSSNNSLAKTIGVKNATTVKHYIDCLQNTYLLFQVSKFDYSLKKQIQNAKKTYFIDNALIKKLGFSFSENTGRMLENLVFIELKRRGCEVYYFSGKHECDFVIRQGYKISEAIQVCSDFANKTAREREISGLLEAMEAHSLKKGLILTEDTEDIIKINRKTIYMKPVWKWAMEEE